MRSNYNLTNVMEKETFGLLSTHVKDIGPWNLRTLSPQFPLVTPGLLGLLWCVVAGLWTWGWFKRKDIER